MSVPRGKEVIIVGSGASGTLLAVQLLRDRSAHIRVTLVEKGQQPGLGLAYSTSNPSHLLNVRAANMSAFADDPDHFVRWLASGSRRGRIALRRPLLLRPAQNLWPLHRLIAGAVPGARCTFEPAAHRQA